MRNGLSADVCRLSLLSYHLASAASVKVLTLADICLSRSQSLFLSLICPWYRVDMQMGKGSICQGRLNLGVNSIIILFAERERNLPHIISAFTAKAVT